MHPIYIWSQNVVPSFLDEQTSHTTLSEQGVFFIVLNRNKLIFQLTFAPIIVCSIKPRPTNHKLLLSHHQCRFGFTKTRISLEPTGKRATKRLCRSPPPLQKRDFPHRRKLGNFSVGIWVPPPTVWVPTDSTLDPPEVLTQDSTEQGALLQPGFPVRAHPACTAHYPEFTGTQKWKIHVPFQNSVKNSHCNS